jgi:hypothetical protein
MTDGLRVNPQPTRPRELELTSVIDQLRNLLDFDRATSSGRRTRPTTS